MRIIYKYSKIYVRWDCSSELSVREDLQDCVPLMYCIYGCDKKEIPCIVGDDGIVTAELDIPLAEGSYDMYIDWYDANEKVVYQSQVEGAFAVSSRQVEAINGNGAETIVKLRSGRTINVAVAPTPIPVVKEGDWLMEIDTDGDTLMAWGESKVITCRIYDKWHREKTDEVTRWQITRDTEDAMADESWQYTDRVRNFHGIITLYFGKYVQGESVSQGDLINDLGQPKGVSTKFTILAEMADGSSASMEMYV